MEQTTARCPQCSGRAHEPLTCEAARQIPAPTMRAHEGRQYAANLTGTAQLAWNEYHRWRGVHMTLPSGNGDLTAAAWAGALQARTLCEGRMQAYATVVRHITGRHPLQYEDEAELEQYLGVGTWRADL